MIKIFLTDVDDCLFSWCESMIEWTSRHYPQYIPVEDPESQWNIWNKFENMTPEQGEQLLAHFNTCAKQGYMPPKRDSKRFVNMLIAQGWRFVARSTGVSPENRTLEHHTMLLNCMCPTLAS